MKKYINFFSLYLTQALKLKAYLISGARQLPGMGTPNYMTGYGALCVSDSIPWWG